MQDDDRPTPGGRHAAARPRRRRAPLLLSLGTVIGIWLGVSAPEVSPVSAPTPVVQAPVVQQPPAQLGRNR